MSGTFPADWPASCPPADAEDAAGAVFRITINDPPKAEDMLSHHETGRLPNAEPCLRCGLSVFRNIEDAQHQRRLMPRLGKYIATADLQAYHGKTKLTTGSQPTHTTWWVYQEVTNRFSFFKVVKEGE